MRLRVFPSVEAPSQARRKLDSLASRIDQGSLMTVRSVISELVGMSVASGARKTIEVDLRLDDGQLEGLLCDDGTGARAISRRDSSSLVLRIVDGLVEEWGTTNDGAEGIWFRMNVQPV
jgi:anti-sigma regulatory factor (Ser/Thr protein kinase)